MKQIHIYVPEKIIERIKVQKPNKSISEITRELLIAYSDSLIDYDLAKSIKDLSDIKYKLENDKLKINNELNIVSDKIRLLEVKKMENIKENEAKELKIAELKEKCFICGQRITSDIGVMTWKEDYKIHRGCYHTIDSVEGVDEKFLQHKLKIKEALK